MLRVKSVDVLGLGIWGFWAYHRYIRSWIIAVQRTARFVRIDPRAAGAGKVHGSSLPTIAIATSDIGCHDTVADTRAFEQCDLGVGIVLRFNMACSESWRDGDVLSIAGSVHDEDIGTCHSGSLPKDRYVSDLLVVKY